MIITSGKPFKYVLLVACILLTTACQTLPEEESANSEPQTPSVSAPVAPQTDEPSEAEAVSRPVLQEIREIGTGQFLAQQPQEEQIRQTEGNITLNFQNTDLREFIEAVLSDVLNVNYVIDQGVTGQVTIETTQPISRDEVLPLFENILDLNNAAMVESPEGFYQILPKARAARNNLSATVVPRTAQAGHSIRIIPLQFIAAQEMNKILEPFIAEGVQVTIDPKRNLMIVSGNSNQIGSVQDIIDLFDVDWLRGMSVGLYPLQYVNPSTMQNELNSILSGLEGATESTEALTGLVRVVPIERLNSILIISSTASALREVELWMYRLDRPGDHVGKRLYVYNVQNAKATDLSEILGHIFGTTESTISSQTLRDVELAPGLRPVEISNQVEMTNEAIITPSPSQAPQSPAATSSPTDESVAIISNGDIKIIADDTHNSLVILATPQEYRMVEDAIIKLDVVPLQVLIEASIIEVTLNNNLNYGVEWFFKNNIDSSNNRDGEGLLDLGSTGISALVPGFSYVIKSSDQVRFALNALREVSELNVLSSPSLMVLDNNTAMINVGDEIPVPTRQSTSTINPDSPTINEIQFRQTGVTLTVTPRVNAGGLVTMEINQEVSNAVATTTSSLNAPTIQQRQIQSVVAINSGDTIVLGGLIQDSQTEGADGVPGFSRIPLLGNLFKQVRNDKRRTELLVLITPRVVTNRDEANEITEEFRRKLQGIRPIPAT